MAWQITGTAIGPCSCKVSCPCELGELEGDQGWCSGVFVLDLASGNIDGVDVGGTKIAFIGDWPSGFLAGNGKGRVVCDPAVTAEQQAALEAVITGQKGGVWEAIGSLVSEILPTLKAPISITRSNGDISATVGDFGAAKYTPLRGPTGEVTRVLHGAAAFRDDVALGKGTGTKFSPPDMRSWEGGGHSELLEFNWSA
jgi:hypothetical protein